MSPTNNTQRCLCGKLMDSRHASSCIKTRKMCLEPRHDTVRDAVKSVLERFNILSFIEYRPLSHTIIDGKPKRVRPDGCTPGLNNLWDICVTNPACDSYVKRNSHLNGLVAAHINETIKSGKYDGVAANEGYLFTPLIFEAYGGFGEKAREFLCRASELAVDVSGGGTSERSDVINHMRMVIAFAIVKGNARMIKNSLLLSQRRQPSSHTNESVITITSRRGCVRSVRLNHHR